MNALKVEGLSKRYKSFSLENVSFELPSGCIMGLIGENGAGKSTTIKALLGLISKDSGNISILGDDISNDNIRDKVGVVLDNVGIPPAFNVKDVDFIMKDTYSEWNSDTYYSYIKKFDLPEKTPFQKYSKGMKMRLGFAIALSHNAKLLILDEPTSGLDPVMRDEIIDILNDFTREEDHSILISSHIVSDLEKLCDYITFLHKGKLVLCEEKDVLLEQYGFVNMPSDRLEELDPSSIIGRKEGKFSTEAIVEKAKIPNGFETKPITIEELFVFMVKKTEQRKIYT